MPQAVRLAFIRPLRVNRFMIPTANAATSDAFVNADDGARSPLRARMQSRHTMVFPRLPTFGTRAPGYLSMASEIKKIREWDYGTPREAIMQTPKYRA